MVFREVAKKIPLIRSVKNIAGVYFGRIFFRGSQAYWESRYKRGKTSGPGSYGKMAELKAEVLNSFVKGHGIRSVLEFGCGDGNQLSLATYPKYVGLDVSKTVIHSCKERFKHDKTKSFFLYDPDCFEDKNSGFKAELTLSLDVIYHLVEDMIFELYMKHLFSAAEKFVIIYSNDTDFSPFQRPYMKNRHFSKWVNANFPKWKLKQKIQNKYDNRQAGLSIDFFIYEKI